MDEQVRIDKWLWAVRIFKTRSMAAEACKKGQVSIDDMPVKSSRVVKVGDVVHVRRGPVTYQYSVKAVASKRMGAKLVPGFMEDITPAEELKLLEMQKYNFYVRDRGAGRPTKKERRELDDFFE